MPFVGGWVGYNYAPEKIVVNEILVEKQIQSEEVLTNIPENVEYASTTNPSNLERTKFTDVLRLTFEKHTFSEVPNFWTNKPQHEKHPKDDKRFYSTTKTEITETHNEKGRESVIKELLNIIREHWNDNVIFEDEKVTVDKEQLSKFKSGNHLESSLRITDEVRKSSKY